jgi:hypothetical protein
VITALFDTSGINRLLDDDQSGHIIAGIQAAGQIWVSALNVSEAICTKNSTRRVGLLKLQKAMTINTSPIEMPVNLLRRSLAAYARRDKTINYTVEGDNTVLWSVLNDPDRINESARSAMAEDMKRHQSRIDALHEGAWPKYQAKFRNGMYNPWSAAECLRIFCSQDEFVHEHVNRLYKDVNGDSLPISEVRDILRTVPELAAFLLAWGHTIYSRAISQNFHGKRTNAGIVDLWFATYLPRLNWFVTNDKMQYKALRLVAAYIAPNCRVMPYRRMREMLLVGS